uniref:PXA domain-containing protein n=1 Tax=Macrostomum lignano TaxID=282301 RepID=A0A1I8IP06_9PLAT
MFSILLYLLLYVSSFLIGLAVIWYLTDKTNWIRYEDNSSESSESVSCSAEPHCTVCGNSNCYRPRSASTSSFPPYLNINFTVDEPVSDALFECDIGQFVEDQVIPGAVAHYQVCNDVLRRGHLHVAMKDRTAEYDYVKGLVSKVLPHLLHPTAKGSKSLEMLLTEILTVAVLMPALDSLANPHTVNRLILEALDDFPLPQPSGQPVARVPVLHRYTEMAMAASKAEWQQQQQQP